VISFDGEEFGIVDAHVMAFGNIDCILYLEAIGVNHSVRSDSLFNDREQGFGSCVRHDGRKHLAALLK
jgi:hypothetical protein